MDTNRLKRFATEARNILMQGVAHRFTALGFLPDGNVTEEPLPMGGGATFMGDTVSEDFYQKWCSLQRAVKTHSIEEVAEEAAYTWFNRMVAIRIMVKNGLIAPVLQYESEGVHIPLLVSEARQGRMQDMSADDQRKLEDLLLDDSKTDEQFRILIVAFCHANPVINNCFGHISDYTELLLPTNILIEGGFVDMLNNTEFISEEDYHSPELIGWLYQFYISEKKDNVFASFKKGKKAEAKDIPAATQIFTPNWIVKYMVQNTIGRIYLDNNPYEEDIQKNWKYLVEPSEPTPKENILHYDDLKELKFADLASGSGHILNEGFDMLYDLYVLEGYSRSQAIENIFRYNLTGVDIDTRAKQLAQFALLLKACQKDSSFADAHIMPRVLDMPEPYPYKDNLRDTLPHFFLGGNQEMIQEVCDAIDLMDQAKNLGSIMKFNISERTRNAIMIRMEEYEKETHVPEAIRQLMPYMSVILALTEKYSALVMNPPYMGSGNMNSDLAEYAKQNYEEGKADLMTIFMMMAVNRSKANGFWAMINLPSWMFIASFKTLRFDLLSNQHIDSLLHLGRGVFGSDFGSVAFVIRNALFKASGIYRRLFTEHVQVRSVSQIMNNYLDKSYGYFQTFQENFTKIPNYPIAYWISKNFLALFGEESLRGKTFSPGLNKTANNDLYLRFIWEISSLKIGLGKRWLPSTKGGVFRRWYGNLDYVNDWDESSILAIRQSPSGSIINEEYLGKEGISWSSVTAGSCSFRYLPSGYTFNNGGLTLHAYDDCKYYIGLLNSIVFSTFNQLTNPTINLNNSNVQELPYIESNRNYISDIVSSSISISKSDWDSHETSWDFQRNELLTMDEQVLMDNLDYIIEKHYKETGEHICIDPSAPQPESVEWCYDTYCTKWERLFMQLHDNEEELNRQFIEIYGLQDELTPDVPLDEITILQQGEIKIEDGELKWNADVVMKQLISYAVGCMMGRYSIDKPGLILANQGDGLDKFNEQVPNSRFEPDDDGIIPLMSAQSDFADNATIRFKQWLVAAFGEETLVENLNFIEKCLGKSIDDYFVKDFWKDHKKMYQNRPIYWLFSSKKGAFQCLAYMHRTDAYTAERIRTKYLLPHIEWLMQKQSEMEANAANLNARERKELDSIGKQIEECREYHDRLHVIADEQIAFDLDDGVVVNYAKFGDVLSKLK
ncbi:BREX-1 system adenine-specific DNA-methyltransferase PglX [Prevotella histicola]|uniref:BREX-1 system adenine-specific DNA-methyltransferase PglX n=1 Tax=Prevotella histicola TaxID=470565 RepID=UPI0028E3DD58|nr:BREX-1 system adenine-specific DNA-methyltransferase PglX [Prevotella histicola]